MANVNIKPLYTGGALIELKLQADGSWRVVAFAQFEFPDTGEVGPIRIDGTITAAQADPATGARFGQIINAIKTQIRSELENYRGKTNTVIEE